MILCISIPPRTKREMERLRRVGLMGSGVSMVVLASLYFL
jgi:hypothetical protein